MYFNEKIAVALLWDLPIVLCVYMENWRLGEQQQGPTHIIGTTLTSMKVGSVGDMGCKVACRWVAAVVKLRQLKLGALYEIYQ